MNDNSQADESVIKTVGDALKAYGDKYGHTYVGKGINFLRKLFS